ncbi:hypothetical protein V8G54_035497 [Vigna mungo]|uniref:Proliferating cell nuclear antigen PCNA C-terminal domain-containing protein n=1 Tax=Vigna mungo TaxID=3915 RepID=A0AAQ3REH2_VIGMU
MEECPEQYGVTLVFQNPRHDKTSEFIMKEISIDKEHVLHISEVNEEIKFITKGELGTSIVTCRQKFDVDKPEESVVIEMNEPIRGTFSLKLINSVTKAACLSDRVSFLREMPSVVEYKIVQTGYAREGSG